LRREGVEQDARPPSSSALCVVGHSTSLRIVAWAPVESAMTPETVYVLSSDHFEREGISMGSSQRRKQQRFCSKAELTDLTTLIESPQTWVNAPLDGIPNHGASRVGGLAHWCHPASLLRSQFAYVWRYGGMRYLGGDPSCRAYPPKDHRERHAVDTVPTGGRCCWSQR
jgi:hypothetical protein